MQPQPDEAATGQPQASDASSDAANAARCDGDHAASASRGDARAIDGLRAAVLAFARARLAPLSTEDAAAITGLRDERALNELVDTLAQATNLEEARAVLAAAIAGTRP